MSELEFAEDLSNIFTPLQVSVINAIVDAKLDALVEDLNKALFDETEDEA